MKMNQDIQLKMIELQGKEIKTIKIKLAEFLQPTGQSTIPHPLNATNFSLSGMQRSTPDFMVPPPSVAMPAYPMYPAPQIFQVQNPEHMPGTFMMPEVKANYLEQQMA